MDKIKGIYFGWRDWVYDFKSLPTVKRLFHSSTSMLESSSCFQRDSYQLYDVLIRKAPQETDTFDFYTIEQAVDAQHPLWRDQVGSIQIFKDSQEIWVRWRLGGPSLRLFEQEEFAKLLDIFEHAQSPLQANLLQAFEARDRLSHFYKY